MGDQQPARVNAATVPVIVLPVVLVIALILGLATGSLNERIWNRPPPSPTDPITVPVIPPAHAAPAPVWGGAFF